MSNFPNINNKKIKTKKLEERYVVFCEGDTEYNYISGINASDNVKLSIKPVNMHGGGYNNFLNKIKKESNINCIARFVIVDGDRAANDIQEKNNLILLINFCIDNNKKGNTPYFVIVNTPNFEYIACLHDKKYTGGDANKYIQNNLTKQNLQDFKKDKLIFSKLNNDRLTFENVIARKCENRVIINNFIKEKPFIKWKNTEYFDDNIGKKGSNIREFFNIVVS